MKNGFRMRVIGVAITAMLASSAWAEGWSDVALGTAGGAIGGIVGNQVGNGRGRTVATAIGAATGTVIASGCKVSTGTVVGGALGGLLGSQVGGGNGKNLMAGVGAAVGAWLGSDCSPVAMAAKPSALPGPAFRFNGLVMTPVNGFPVDAFQGVPPIVTTEDLASAREVVKGLTASAAKSYKDGDVESAMLKMYWAKRIGTVALSVSGASLSALSNIKVGGPQAVAGAPVSRAQLAGASVTAAIPAKTLVILPALDDDGVGDKVAGLGVNVPVASVNWGNGVQVADNGGGVAGFMNAIGSLGKAIGTPDIGKVGPTDVGKIGVPVDFLGLQENQVLQMGNGAYVMKSNGNLTIYNPGEKEIAIPLDKLDFVPRMPVPSAARQAAADLMKVINANTTRWAFGEYKRKAMIFDVVFEAPNRLRDLRRNGEVVSFVDANGAVSSQQNSGEQRYRSDTVFRIAADVMTQANKASPVNDFKGSCRMEHLNIYDTLGGRYASTFTRICFKGEFGNGNENQVATRTFWLGEAGQAVQTAASALKDKEVRDTMALAMGVGKVSSDLLAFAPGAGNVESGLQCIGEHTVAQHSLVTAAFKTSTLNGDVFAKARLVGWEPEKNEWGMERVANCVGAIPLAGNLISAGKKVGALGKGVLSSMPNLDRLESVFNAFDTPNRLKKYVEGVQNVEALYPGNPLAAGFVKSVYDGVMTGQNITQLKDDFMQTSQLPAM